MNKCRYCNKTVKWNERYFEDYCSVLCAKLFVEQPLREVGYNYIKSVQPESTLEMKMKELEDMLK